MWDWGWGGEVSSFLKFKQYGIPEAVDFITVVIAFSVLTNMRVPGCCGLKINCYTDSTCTLDTALWEIFRVKIGNNSCIKPTVEWVGKRYS